MGEDIITEHEYAFSVPQENSPGFVAVGDGIHRDSPGLVELLDWSCGSQFIKRFTGRSLMTNALMVLP